jgi:hypothetical protein
MSHGEPTWFVRDKKSFVMFCNRHHGGPFGFWCAAPFGAQDALITSDPNTFYRPPYVGHRGWLGVKLEAEAVDWSAMEQIVREAYRTVAPPRLASVVGGGQPTDETDSG